jgi:hypothetical protein
MIFRIEIGNLDKKTQQFINARAGISFYVNSNGWIVLTTIQKV